MGSFCTHPPRTRIFTHRPQVCQDRLFLPWDASLSTWRSGMACSRVCMAATAFRPVAIGVGGAERGAPMSQSAYRRVCGAATPKGVAQRGCSATGPTPRATGSSSHVRAARRQDPCTHARSFLFSNSFTFAGLAIPPDAFITCPTKNPKTSALPLRY
jgi:hypothetical protein